MPIIDEYGLPKQTPEELATALNGWPEGTVGFLEDSVAIKELDRIGARIGYGRMQQLSNALFEIQCNRNSIEPYKKAREKRLKLLSGED